MELEENLHKDSLSFCLNEGANISSIQSTITEGLLCVSEDPSTHTQKLSPPPSNPMLLWVFVYPTAF